jgi:hypothetical protein
MTLLTIPWPLLAAAVFAVILLMAILIWDYGQPRQPKCECDICVERRTFSGDREYYENLHAELQNYREYIGLLVQDVSISDVIKENESLKAENERLAKYIAENFTE